MESLIVSDSEKRAQLTAHWKFPRQRAAQKRHKLSSPITAAIEQGYLTRSDTLFDYGCGKGDIPRILNSTGYYATGFDPYYFPLTPLESADVVNLAFVLATIEDPDERQKTLLNAWSLTGKHLIVAAQVQHSRGEEPWGDGFITCWGTWVKYWTSPEFREYVESVLDKPARRLGKGIWVVSR